MSYKIWLFTEEAFVSPIAQDIHTSSANNLNNDLVKINKCAHMHPWKICFNPDPFKQAREVIFSLKIKS